MAKNIEHVLVIRSSAMGDVAMTVPVLLAFRKAYPSVKLTLLTNTFFTPFFEQIPDLEIFNLDAKGKHKGVLGIKKLATELKLRKIDAVADLHNVLRTNVLKSFFLLTGIPFIQIDKGRKEKKDLTRWVVKEIKPLVTTTQRYAEVFQKLGFELNFQKESYFLKKEKIESETQTIIGLDTKKWIGIAPFAKHDAKTYDFDQLSEVVKILSETGRYKILLFGGGENEIQRLSKVEAAFENVISVAGKISFQEEVKLISNLDIMVAMDSGNGHIAAMYGIPVVTIWGVTHPYAGFAPYMQPIHHSITPHLEKYPYIPTSVFGNKYPSGYQEAVNSISPHTIVDKIEETLR